jgi:BA14K-like protein
MGIRRPFMPDTVDGSQAFFGAQMSAAQELVPRQAVLLPGEGAEIMSSLRVLSAAAVLALTLPLVSPTTSFAQSRGMAVGGGRSGPSGGSFSAGVRSGGPSFAAAPAIRSGGSFAAAPAVRSGVVGAPTFNSGRIAAAPSGTWNGGTWNGGHWRHHHGGFWPGFVAGAAIGGLGSYAYYNDPYYYDDGYYDDYYYDQGPTVAVVPGAGGDSVAYCEQRYRSYDPASGTYLGYDGLRHPCP